jgi:iron complex outermembrane recepter protein
MGRRKTRGEQMRNRSVRRSLVISNAVSLVLASYAGATLAQETKNDKAVELEKYVAVGKGEDPIGVLPAEPVDSVFGFDKSLMETPRSVSVLTDDMMAAYGIENALDVSKIVPSTFTTSVFGINGNVNIRGVASDTYFRGVKRIENTQLFPSPITAMSRLDVVRGPPSPLYGPGKVGGYTNFVPKSARASTGKYLETPKGKFSFTGGSYDKLAGSAEIGGPFALFGRRGGYYVYLSAEDSGTFYKNVPFKQYIVQSSFDFQLADKVRLEFGQMYQYWGGTELAGWNRVTQELINDGTYNTGVMAVNLDTNHDGLISTKEVDANGALLKTIPGTTSAAAVAAQLGSGWNVDPATVHKAHLDRSANSQSPEDGGAANVFLEYFDVIYQPTENSTLTNKLYNEHMYRYKWSRASAFGQNTDTTLSEEKLIFETALIPRTDEYGLNFGVSALWRHYQTENLTGTKYNDLDNRADLTQSFNTLNRFAVPNLEPDLAPWNSGLNSTYTSYGVGTLIDGTYGKTNVVLGTRYDWVDHIHSDIPTFVLTTPGLSARGSDSGLSWSASVSHEVYRGIRPYVTYAVQQTIVYGADGGIGIAVVPNAFNTAELREAGVKTSLFDNKLFASLSLYRQTRTSFSADTLQVLSTLSDGWELEARWAVNSRLSLTAGGTWQGTKYQPLRPATVSVNPSFYGLPDGTYYGGRLQTTISNNPRYGKRPGYPDTVLNLNGTFFFTKELSLNCSTSYQGATYTGRIRDIVLPSAILVGASLNYDAGRFGFRFAVNNLTDARYYTPNSADSEGEIIVIPAPDRNFLTTFTYKF